MPKTLCYSTNAVIDTCPKMSIISINPQDCWLELEDLSLTSACMQSRNHVFLLNESIWLKFVKNMILTQFNSKLFGREKHDCRITKVSMIDDYFYLYFFRICILNISLSSTNKKSFLFYRKPQNIGSRLYDYKGHRSMIMLALVDAHYRFRYVNVGAQGRANAGVGERCKLR